MANGAQNALAGYLYQFVGAAGLAARAQTPLLAHPHRLRGLFTLINGSKILHELKDMDAAVLLAGSDDAVGVQYKYSNTTPPRAVDGQELIEILDAFHRSATQADGLHFVEYVLISNRPINNAAKLIYETRGRATPTASLFPGLRRLGVSSKATKKAIDYYGDKHKAAAARHEILSKLVLYLDIDREDLLQQIKQYANLHGVRPSEFEEAFSNLLGRILHRTVGDPLELSTDFLNRALLGTPDARALGPSGSAGGAREAAQVLCSDFIAHTLTDNQDTLIRRRFLDDLEKGIRLHPLVFVVGEGGSGKSVLAAQYLRQMARDRFVATIVASELNGDWPGLAFNTWRSPGYSGDLHIESIDTILARLRQADRETSRPILILDLDGIDEIGHEYRHAARRLIGEFLRRDRGGSADAVLLATCRSDGPASDRAFRSLIARWLTTDVPSNYTESVGRVVVGDFDGKELLEAAGALGGVYRTRLQSLYGSIANEPPNPLYVGDEGTAAETYLGNRPDFVRSFLHPAMWRAFVELAEEERIRVLDQEPAALRELADKFLERFCRKAERRRPALSEARALRALRTICAALPLDPSILDRQKHWIEAARGPVGDEEAAQLFEEAISYGLIIEDERGHWSWRHGIVSDYLRVL